MYYLVRANVLVWLANVNENWSPLKVRKSKENAIWRVYLNREAGNRNRQKNQLDLIRPYPVLQLDKVKR
jgi:hypothetical protein